MGGLGRILWPGQALQFLAGGQKPFRQQLPARAQAQTRAGSLRGAVVPSEGCSRADPALGLSPDSPPHQLLEFLRIMVENNYPRYDGEEAALLILELLTISFSRKLPQSFLPNNEKL